MSCDCNLSKEWSTNHPYAIACKLINNNDVVIDVGCSDGAGLHNIKNHLKTHNKDVITVGIDVWHIKEAHNWSLQSEDILKKLGGLDFLKNRDIERMESLDEFINKPVEIVNLDKIADVVLCFGFARFDKYDRKESYRRMALFLKPDGKAVYEVFKQEKYWKITTRRILKLFGMKIPDHSTWKRVMYVKTMSKQEAISHAENCIIGDMIYDGDNCNHGVIIDMDRRLL